VLARSPGFAPAHAALGVTHLQYVQGGFGGLIQLMAAQQCLDAALALDPHLTEADLYRVLTLLARGDKEAARRATQRLLESAGHDFDVRLVAGTILRLDGLFEPALRELGAALALNPAGAVVVYDQRARIHQYEGQLELALQELQKGLVLEPRHPRLRTSLGYLRLRLGDVRQAVALLEEVLVDARDLRLAHPTLALAYHAAGETQKARDLVTEDVLLAADADGEMAYRLATQFAYAGDVFEALHWLRKAVYRGNENWPWFAVNPWWRRLAGNADLKRVLRDLERTWRENRRRWQGFLRRRGR
jgi:tetratricopeptide (TPR) repeat protein